MARKDYVDTLLALALVSGATYIARSFSEDIPQTTRIIEEGFRIL
ncbi:MAG: hypothetical protein ACUVTD_00020 [Nitrososphaerales archaeon]